LANPFVAVADVAFFVDVLDVRCDGAYGNEQLLGDLFVAVVFVQKVGDFDFSL